MPASLEGWLVVSLSSCALFDFEEENRVFEDQDDSASVAGALGTAPAGDVKVKGTPYHATGALPCAAGKEAPGSKQCEFGAIRGKPGNAEVHVTYPGSYRRVLSFIGDKVGADGGARIKTGRSGDMWSVKVSDYEHYQIPEAVINGG